MPGRLIHHGCCQASDNAAVHGVFEGNRREVPQPPFHEEAGPSISHEFGFPREISSQAPDKKKARWIAMLLRVSATYTLPYSGEF